MAKKSFMEPGMCQRHRCFNYMLRCGKGFCMSCCRAFHERCSHSQAPSPGVHIVASNISTAVQPEPPAAYEVGAIRLVCAQDIP
jgi:hypothetical protein